jgi:NAD(P)-dependent dehydrogenase (short-subunit alcohol dehydrogenase family)
MKIVIIGATGTIGKSVVNELKSRHEIIQVGFQSGDANVDITNNQSIENLYKKIGAIDAVIMTTGNAHFGRLIEMSETEFNVGIKSKLMGQINTVLIGLKYLNDNGSFTLTSGVLSHDPILYGSAVSMVNSAIDGFVRGAAIEMPRGLRINAVSPTVIRESMKEYGAYFRGFDAVPAAKAALAYSKSAEGLQTGQIYSVL